VSNSSISVTVKLFAAFQEAYGVSEITLEFPQETTVSQVLEHSIAQYPQLEHWRDLTRFGLNLEFVSSDTLLQDGDEVVLIPPVSGG
jgi:sulfur-carrier protein